MLGWDFVVDLPSMKKRRIDQTKDTVTNNNRMCSRILSQKSVHILFSFSVDKITNCAETIRPRRIARNPGKKEKEIENKPSKSNHEHSNHK